MDSKVVIRTEDRIVKGSTNLHSWIADILNTEELVSPPIQSEDGTEQTSLENIKAVFFVKSLEGTSHTELRYHDHKQPLPCLWVRVTFFDGEIIEGLVRNEWSLLSGSRFMMGPVDPQSNNRLILVFKSQLTDFKVLGLRDIFDELHDFFKEPLQPAPAAV